MEKTIGFIGMGNMGSAMLKGAMKEFDKSELVFTEISKERMEAVSKELGIDTVSDNSSCVKTAKYVVLAVKPQFYKDVLDDIKDSISEENVIISIAPGKTLEYLRSELGENVKLVRAMPNTPALVNEGMTGICYNKEQFTCEELNIIEKFFNSFGKVTVVDEKLMNAIVCASGSSPAYVYMFIEAMADSVVKYGIPRKQAYELVAQTVLGSAKMVLETGIHPGELKDNVCSPGGTTIAGVAALEENGFRNAIIKATDKCYEKCTNI